VEPFLDRLSGWYYYDLYILPPKSDIGKHAMTICTDRSDNCGDRRAQEEVLAILRRYKAEFAQQYGILAIGVFGSVAREETGRQSDVDVVLRIAKPDLFLLAGIKNDLEEKLHRPVDLVTYREGMNPFLRKKIEGEAIYA
jgi:uncharacterized protein